MRPVPLLFLWQLVPLPPLQPSLRLWAPPMDTQPLALDQVDMDLVMDQVDMDQVVMDQVDMDQVVMDQVVMDQVDMDLDMAVLVVCMAPTWEHCSLMVSFVKVFKINVY